MNPRITIQRLRRPVSIALAAAVLAAAGVFGSGTASAASTVHMLRDIRAGANNSNPTDLTPVGNVLFFTANDSKGRELWKSDGTAGGTVRVKDIRVGSKGSIPTLLTNVAGTLFFIADDGVHGRELWKSDGSAAGTKMVEELITVPDGDLTSLTNVNGTLFFFRGTTSLELWTSDGTAAGTSLVEVLDPTEPYYGNPLPLLVDDGLLYFQASGVWKSDGTPEGTAPVDFTDNAQWMIKVNSTYYFSHYEANYRTEMWRSDGTPEGTELVKDINTLPCTDGCSGTYASEPSKPVVMNGAMYFTAYDSDFYRNVWRSDGTEQGTQLVAAFDSGEPIVLGSKLLFAGDPPSDVDFELMRSDGTAAGTHLVKRISPAGSYFGSYPYDLTRVGNRVYFTADPEAAPFPGPTDRELYRTDGTKAGTRLVLDIHPSDGSEPRNLTAVGSSLYFTANDGIHGRELWRVGP